MDHNASSVCHNATMVYVSKICKILCTNTGNMTWMHFSKLLLLYYYYYGIYVSCVYTVEISPLTDLTESLKQVLIEKTDLISYFAFCTTARIYDFVSITND